MSFYIGDAVAWFSATGETTNDRPPNPARAAFYVGMQLEELAEKIEAIMGKTSPLAQILHEYGHGFKQGQFVGEVLAAMTHSPEQLLDADVDLIWVSLGAAVMQGADIEEAYNLVSEANWNKKFPDHKFHRAEGTNKIMKPEGWTAPDLSACVHSTLQRKD
jgi:predicted HAD superfamily Cof-like phosphohydrolase